MTASIRVRPGDRAQRGYILLTLMLFAALLAITAAAVAPSIAFQIRRDREEELIHRGVQYSRAIRRYVKKNGGYPVRIEQLENTNNIRYLRKRYKDPITGQDFKILHLGDVKLSFGPGLAGANPAGGANATAVTSIGGGTMQGPGGMTMQGPGGVTMQGPGGMTMQGPVGATTQGVTAAATSAATPAGQDTSGLDTSQPNSGAQPQSQPNQGMPAGGDQLPAALFGGGPIVGVASTSKVESIREFNKKNHYHQWQFIYDPASDRGGLLSTPNQPPLQVAAPAPQQVAPGGLGGNFGSQGQPAPGQPMPQNQPTGQEPPQ